MYRRDGSPDAGEGAVTVSGFTKCGAATDLEPFSFKLNGQGAPVDIPNSIAAALAADRPP